MAHPAPPRALLWRGHRAHHVDLDLDASTAARFHFAEFLLSIPWRAAQVVLIGATPRTLDLWAKLTLAEVMTPRLHGIHHSTVDEERDSNFSSGLTPSRPSPSALQAIDVNAM